MFCASCGKKVKADKIYCSSCGKKVKKNSFKKYLIIILALAAITAVLIFVPKTLKKYKNKQKQETATTETETSQEKTEEPKKEEIKKLFSKTELPEITYRFSPIKDIELLNYNNARKEAGLKANDLIFLRFYFKIDDWRETIQKPYVTYRFYSPLKYITYEVSFHSTGVKNLEEKQLNYENRIRQPGLEFPTEFTAQEATIMAAAALQLIAPKKEIKKIIGSRDYQYKHWRITLYPTEGSSLDYYPFEVTETSVNYVPRPKYEPKK